MFRDWMRIARSQTASAVIMLCGIFFLLGKGDLFSLYGFALIIFSIFIHDVSFAHNSVIDVLTGYDTKDKFKKHFPLCNGRFDSYTALKIIHVGGMVSLIVAILLAYFGSGNPFYAISFYAIFIFSGFWYNEWTSKIVVWDFVPISICFTSLALYAYFLVRSEINMLVLLCAVYIYLTEWFQIGVSGEIKEVEIQEEISMLRLLGAECNSVFHPGFKAFVYAWSIKIAGIILLGIIVFKYNFTVTGFMAFVFMSAGMMYFAYHLLKVQRRDRDMAIRMMASEEIISIFALPLILIPIIDIFSTIFLIFLSMVYFMVMNKLNWGTLIRPQV